MNVLEAIPNFMALLHSFKSNKVTDTTTGTTDSTDERTSRAKKR